MAQNLIETSTSRDDKPRAELRDLILIKTVREIRTDYFYDQESFTKLSDVKRECLASYFDDSSEKIDYALLGWTIGYMPRPQSQRLWYCPVQFAAFVFDHYDIYFFIYDDLSSLLEGLGEIHAHFHR